MSIPPCRGEGVEMGDFDGVDGGLRLSGGGGVEAELGLDKSRGGLEEEVEISERRSADRERGWHDFSRR